jgi:ankyrin repeat protein
LSVNFSPESDGGWINPVELWFGNDSLELFREVGDRISPSISYQILSGGGRSVKEKIDISASLYIFLSKWIDLEIDDSYDEENICEIDYELIDFGNMDIHYREEMRSRYFALWKDAFDNDFVNLIDAVHSGDKEAIEKLLSTGIDINNIFDRDTPLSTAIQSGNLETVKLLVESGADVNLSNEKEKTPLMIAASYGYTEIVEYLLSQKADIEAKARLSETALVYAVEGNHIKTVELLINKGADIETKNSIGMPLINIAVGNRNKSMVSFLINCGANLNAKDNMFMTPHSYAIYSGFHEIARLLIK